ncbi:hypothetical protein [Micromonospora sp. NBC_01796]|uniref:hypothetical protein n=1 Tax=Micromonospora sp. NBC_01796 TaxID=2975987 RepID=UPI003089E855|nr:hypothetical protein OIE47_32130 [Micromonospora sp. NBC_01796]
MQQAPARARAGRRRGADAAAAGVALALVGLAVVVGWWLDRSGAPVHAGTAPLFATWGPHVGPGTPPALLVAAATIGYGPRLAARLRWPALLAAGYATAVAWIVSLALVDGWRTGLATRLTLDAEYLTEVPGVTDIPAMVRGFADRILDLQPDSWTTHVSGHPPGALLVFVGLDRVGLSGGGWAALVCVAAGAATAVAVPVTVRALGDEGAARRVLPFVVLFPGAVWWGASADAIFAGVTASGLALLAIAARRPAGPGRLRGGPGTATLAAFAGGVLLGFGVYLSYGLVLIAPLVLAVVLVSRRGWPLLPAAIGAAAVVAGFTVAGFRWYDGYHLVVERYYQGIARERPYAYWVWANLASLVLAAGPACVPALRRAVLVLRPLGGVARRASTGPVALSLAAAFAIVVADLSGMSKAEVERIWLPFAVWLTAATALLPQSHPRRWLAVQAVTALAVNHLVWTVW